MWTPHFDSEPCLAGRAKTPRTEPRVKANALHDLLSLGRFSVIQSTGAEKTTTESRGVHRCRVYKNYLMMPDPQSESAAIAPPRFHRPFRFYDPEAVAILTILFGLFQVLLGIPTFYLGVNIRMLYMCPVFVGAVHVTGGSFALACERSPSRQLLKNCLYFAVGGLFVGLSATVVYGYAFNNILSLDPCDSDQHSRYSSQCERDEFVDFFRAFTTLLSIYDVVALFLQCFISFSALKGDPASQIHHTFGTFISTVCPGKSMEKLQDLSHSELQDLLDNSERVESMALESDEIQNIQLEREMALASNRSLAEQNLDMKPRLERERERLVEKYAELEEVRERYKQHCALRDGIMGQVSPEGLFSRLQAEGASTEAESEALADEFLEGSLSLDSFLERFHSLRSVAHKRRVCIEKLQEILRQKSQGVGDSGMTSQSCSNPDAGSLSPWQQQQPQQQPQQKPSVSTNPSNSALPYPPYPVSPPNQSSSASAAGPSNPSAAFQPYPNQVTAFTPSTGYPAPRPGFGPSPCPYPTQPAFPAAQGPPFGQYGPTNAPYPNPYPYGGYSYPMGPHMAPSQSPTVFL
ncbi:hypothetical protein MHYP_G00045090 [Metynnis hypsauchen]